MAKQFKYGDDARKALEAASTHWQILLKSLSAQRVETLCSTVLTVRRSSPTTA